VAVCPTEGTAQVPSVVSLPFKATVLSCCLPSRAQIHCSLSLASNNWTPENRLSNLSAQRWLLGPWPSIFKTSETWRNQNVWYIKQFVFRVPKSMAEGRRYLYQRLADALIGLKLTTWHSAQLRRLQPPTILFESRKGLAWLRDCKIKPNNNCSSYAVEDAFHWRWARNEPVPSPYAECSSYTSGREPRVLFEMLRNYMSQYKYSQLHYASLPCNLPTAIIIFLAPLRANSSYAEMHRVVRQSSAITKGRVTEKLFQG